MSKRVTNIKRTEAHQALIDGKTITFYLSDHSSVHCLLCEDGHTVAVEIKKPDDTTHWHQRSTSDDMELHEAAEWISERDVEIE